MINDATRLNVEEGQDDRLLKPLGGYLGYSSEWRDLAQVISRVSQYQSVSALGPLLLHLVNHVKFCTCYQLKDTFSCGPINMKFGPHKICSISTPKPTDRTDCTVKVMWAELRKSWKLGTRRHNCEYCPIMNNDLVKMTSWDCQEGNRACIPKFSSNSIHTISLQIHPKNSIFTILRPRMLQLWYMESYRNISMDAPTVFNNTCIIVMMAND